MYFLNLFFLFLHTCYIYICMFPASCFRNRKYVAQGLFNGVLNETWIHFCFQYKYIIYRLSFSSFGSSCRICWLHLCRGVRPPPQRVYWIWHKAIWVLKLWGIWSNPSLPLLSGPLWTWVVVPFRVPSMGQIELFNHFPTSIKDMTLNCIWWKGSRLVPLGNVEYTFIAITPRFILIRSGSTC